MQDFIVYKDTEGKKIKKREKSCVCWFKINLNSGPSFWLLENKINKYKEERTTLCRMIRKKKKTAG